MKYQLPPEIINIIERLKSAGFEAYAVGGGGRDLLLGREPKDWDVATNARPQEIQKIFPGSVYENEFGTVGVKVRHDIDSQVISDEKEPPQPPLGKRGGETEIIEVTTYRQDGKYIDYRHPEKVVFTDNIREDLARRDFTINAIALNVETKKHENKKTESQGDVSFEIYDLFGGQEDLKNKIIRAVGDPNERFQEDALRLIRAVRFAIELGFEIETKTKQAIIDNVELLKKISSERVRDEFVKIVMSPRAADGLRLLEELKLLKIFLPELVEGVGVAQSKHHIYEVFEHNVRSLDRAVKKKYSLAVRLASLFHDIGKPRTKRGQYSQATFYNHELVGAKMTKQLMRRLNFSNEMVNKAWLLVRYHQFYYTPEEVTPSSVRRLIANVGLDNINELIQVREADRIGSGVPKAVPYKLRHLKFMVEKVSTDPISPKMLKVNGHELMDELGLKPSRKLGLIINSLLAAVIEDPSLNKKETLLTRARELNKLSDNDLAANLKKVEEAQQQEEEEMKRKYYIK